MDSCGSSESSFANERSQPTMEKLPGDWRVHQETGARSFPDDNPNARPFSHLVSSPTRAVSLNQLMIDVLGCGDARENVAQTVTLSTLNGMMGAHNGLDRDTPGWSYRPVCIS